ncbi:hypothetical protein, partial [Mesorhizobium sp. M7A.F.Ca.CA.004.04.2.1]|uniref:hypothetical protein n=1 Tax=Mesorhizobium sp. M7A.F.Ca.CA.004.04.2.1 TaxID=2496677 RepID=UPI0019D4C78F
HSLAGHGKQRRTGIVVEIGAYSGHFRPSNPVRSHSAVVWRYFLEIPRRAVLFTRLAARVAGLDVLPLSFEQF